MTSPKDKPEVLDLLSAMTASIENTRKSSMTKSEAPGSTTSRGPARTPTVKQEVPAVTSIAGDVLRRAAADVEVRGVVNGEDPSEVPGTTCAVVAVREVTNSPRGTDLQQLELNTQRALRVLAASVGQVPWINLAPDWNDTQPSKATVAAEMRNAADLADLLYGRTA